MFIGSIQLVDMAICRYQCQFGPHDFTDVVKDITLNHNKTPKKLDINGKIVPLVIGHKDRQYSMKKWGASIKKRSITKYTIETLYLFKHASKLCFIQ
jgi:hypothetical protein